MSNRQLFSLIRTNFEAAISAKNGWGKNEVIALFDKVSAESMAEFMDSRSVEVDEEEEEVQPTIKRTVPKPPAAKPIVSVGAKKAAPAPIKGAGAKKSGPPWSE